ncbi:hypothetical protein KsCSTR_18560 [Candidatus Kuenenia stuttgartiensis]|uniref:Uncharacterized protein n=1 Tax=Kuenenia stuttgartiensis TaxID=174633 RepID=A0A6G7GNZ2_KUEST|nr:hypothetical protein KsCSTR_18560 [Candidatus Kuenenia stuttgartiensis]
MVARPSRSGIDFYVFINSRGRFCEEYTCVGTVFVTERFKGRFFGMLNFEL